MLRFALMLFAIVELQCCHLSVLQEVELNILFFAHSFIDFKLLFVLNDGS